MEGLMKGIMGSNRENEMKVITMAHKFLEDVGRVQENFFQDDRRKKRRRKEDVHLLKTVMTKKQVALKVVPQLEKFFEALKNLRCLGENSNVISLRHDYAFKIGQIYKHIESYQLALKYFMLSQELAELLGEKESSAREYKMWLQIAVFGELSSVYEGMCDYKKAAVMASKGLENVRSFEKLCSDKHRKLFSHKKIAETKAMIYEKLATAYFLMNKESDMCYKYFVLGEAFLAKRFSYRGTTAFFYYKYCYFLRTNGYPKRALQMMRKSIKKCETSGAIPDDLCFLYKEFSLTLKANAKLEEANKYGKMAVEAARKIEPVGKSSKYVHYLVGYLRFLREFLQFGGISKIRILMKKAESVVSLHRKTPDQGLQMDLSSLKQIQLSLDTPGAMKFPEPGLKKKKKNFSPPTFKSFSKEELVELGNANNLSVSMLLSEDRLIEIISKAYGKEMFVGRKKNAIVGKSCAGCGKNKVKLFHCARCKKACYCGTQCQRKDWKTHKKECSA